ncbi:unnamed protein product [Prorocentrum cordatum]|uniref:Uncharacterized protein n=1 Tax=Prorocentrum cordatum TaxID=2364126 RepID=A0ABN9T8Z3_9DINO|nr:unnamed protein product [Polarella glacialis]
MAVACGSNVSGRCDLPALAAGLTYTQVAGGQRHTVLLRSDGTAVACGDNGHGQCDLPALAADLAYTQVAAGRRHTVLLRSDGKAVACGDNADGGCDLPEVVAGLTYTQVAAGWGQTVLLRSDGTAVACGDNEYGKCALPVLTAGLTYAQVAAGPGHSALLRSDGTAVACGLNVAGRCDLPALAAGLTYTQVAAGRRHTVLLRSDGTAVACGDNGSGQCSLPALTAGLLYAAHLFPALTLLLEASLDGDSVRFLTLGGVERCRARAGPAARLSGIYDQLVADHCRTRLGAGVWRVDAVLPGGRLLSGASACETVADAFGPARALQGGGHHNGDRHGHSHGGDVVDAASRAPARPARRSSQRPAGTDSGRGAGTIGGSRVRLPLQGRLEFIRFQAPLESLAMHHVTGTCDDADDGVAGALSAAEATAPPPPSRRGDGDGVDDDVGAGGRRPRAAAASGAGPPREAGAEAGGPAEGSETEGSGTEPPSPAGAENGDAGAPRDDPLASRTGPPTTLRMQPAHLPGRPPSAISELALRVESLLGRFGDVVGKPEVTALAERGGTVSLEVHVRLADRAAALAAAESLHGVDWRSEAEERLRALRWQTILRVPADFRERLAEAMAFSLGPRSWAAAASTLAEAWPPEGVPEGAAAGAALATRAWPAEPEAEPEGHFGLQKLFVQRRQSGVALHLWGCLARAAGGPTPPAIAGLDLDLHSASPSRVHGWAPEWDWWTAWCHLEPADVQIPGGVFAEQVRAEGAAEAGRVAREAWRGAGSPAGQRWTRPRLPRQAVAPFGLQARLCDVAAGVRLGRICAELQLQGDWPGLRLLGHLRGAGRVRGPRGRARPRMSPRAAVRAGREQRRALCVLVLAGLSDNVATVEVLGGVPSHPALRPADAFTSAAFARLAALDVGVACPGSAGSVADACAAVVAETLVRYADVLLELADEDIEYRALIWFAFEAPASAGGAGEYAGDVVPHLDGGSVVSDDVEPPLVADSVVCAEGEGRSVSEGVFVSFLGGFSVAAVACAAKGPKSVVESLLDLAEVQVVQMRP